MKYEHKAIIDAAKREGKFPMEMAKELLGHDLLKACVTAISGHAVAFNKMTEQQQDSVIKGIQMDLEKALDNAVAVIASQGTHAVRMKLKNVAIGKKWKIVGEADGAEDYLHELADKTQDQSDVLVLLYERDYLQALDAIRGEKDQRDLPLSGDANDAGDTEKGKPDTGKPAGKGGKADPKKRVASGAIKSGDIANGVAKKPIELTDGLVNGAVEFAHKFQNVTHAGLQNHLKIAFDKADALLEKLEELGVATAPDAEGKRQYVRPGAGVAGKDTAANAAEESGAPAAGEASVSDELYEQIKEKVIAEQKISLGFLQSEFAIGSAAAGAAIVMLEKDQIVGPENDLGGRAVLIPANE